MIGNLLYLAKAPKPCIAWVYGNHFVVVTRATEKAVWISDPGNKRQGERKLKAEEFQRMWAGHTLEVTAPRQR
jgi:ABC-type bacteriocin/lantibiotic exporter with double-glycine peptidase domain